MDEQVIALSEYELKVFDKFSTVYARPLDNDPQAEHLLKLAAKFLAQLEQRNQQGEGDKSPWDRCITKQELVQRDAYERNDSSG